MVVLLSCQVNVEEGTDEKSVRSTLVPAQYSNGTAEVVGNVNLGMA